MKRGQSNLESECAEYYRSCVKFGVRYCEVCPSRKIWLMSVHHPLGRHVVYKYDIRNGIFICNDCHLECDHDIDKLVAKMIKYPELYAQSDWIERHRYEIHPQAKITIDLKATRDKLRLFLAALESGQATRESLRDFDE